MNLVINQQQSMFLICCYKTLKLKSMSKQKDNAKEFYDEMNCITIAELYKAMKWQGKVLLTLFFPFVAIGVGVWKVMILLFYWLELCFKDDEDVNVL